jgi:hypothetical protein
MQITNSKALVPVLIACSGLLGIVQRPARGDEAEGRVGRGADGRRVSRTLVRYADLTTMRIQIATREFTAASKAPEAGIQAANWRLDSQRFLTQTAGGPKLDDRDARHRGDALGDAVAPRGLLAAEGVRGLRRAGHITALGNSEKDGWILLERYMDKDLVKKAREVLQGWREQNPALDPAKMIEIPELLHPRPVAEGKGLFDEGLLGMIGLDPLSGLEPVARQVELLADARAARAVLRAARAGG